MFFWESGIRCLRIADSLLVTLPSARVEYKTDRKQCFFNQPGMGGWILSLQEVEADG